MDTGTHSISKLHVPNSRRLKLETRYFGTQWTLDVSNWIIRSSPAISKPNRFPYVVPLLDFNSVIWKPHYSKAHIAIVHDISNVWTKLAESNLSQHSLQLDSDIALQLNMFRHSAHSCQNTVFCSARERHAPENFFVACRSISIGNFSAKQHGLQQPAFEGVFPRSSAAAAKRFGTTNACTAWFGNSVHNISGSLRGRILLVPEVF